MFLRNRFKIIASLAVGVLYSFGIIDAESLTLCPLILLETGAGYASSAIGSYETKKANKKAMSAQMAGQDRALDELETAYNQSQGWLTGQAERNAADVEANNAWLTQQYADREAKNIGMVDTQNALNTRLMTEQNAMNRDSYQPWITAGVSANKEISDIQGLNGTEAQQNAMARFQFDPGYRARLAASNQALERSAAARGNLFSGQTGMALQENSQNLASNEFSNAFNRLMGISQMGLGASSDLTGLNTQNTLSYAQMNNANRNNLMSQNNANMGDFVGMKNANVIGQIDRGNQTNYARIGMGNEYGANRANAALGQAGIMANYYQAQGQNIANTANRMAQYTDTASSNMFNRGMSVASMIGSRGMSGGGGSQQNPYLVSSGQRDPAIDQVLYYSNRGVQNGTGFKYGN